MIRKRFTDDVFAKSDITHVRETVRMIAVYHDRYAFLEIKRDDIFGCLRHLETLGGGIEANESHAQAIQRELLEEGGWEGEILRPLCVIEDTYHLIQRRTISHFYAVRLIRQSRPCAYTEEEKQLIHGLVFLSEEEVLKELSAPNKQSIQKLIYQRDLFAYKCYLETC